MKSNIEHLSGDNLAVWYSLNNFSKFNGPISEALKINGKIYLHFDKDTLYEKQHFIKAGEYALFDPKIDSWGQMKGIVSSDIFDRIAIPSEEIEYYIKSSSNIEIIGSKFESYASSISLYEVSKPTSKEKLAEYKEKVNWIVNEYKNSKPYMQHALSEKIKAEDSLKITKEACIEKIIEKTLEKINSITEEDIEKNFNEEKIGKEKAQAEEINKEFKELENSYNKISTVIEYRDCYKPEDMLKEIINAKGVLFNFKRKSNFENSYFKNNEKLQKQRAKLENTIDKAVESFNKKVDEYNEKNKEKLPYLSSKKDAEKYNLENFTKDDIEDDFADFINDENDGGDDVE